MKVKLAASYGNGKQDRRVRFGEGVAAVRRRGPWRTGLPQQRLYLRKARSDIVLFDAVCRSCRSRATEQALDAGKGGPIYRFDSRIWAGSLPAKELRGMSRETHL